MRKLIRILIITAILGCGYLIVSMFFPKQVGRYPFLALLFLGDVYLWLYILKRLPLPHKSWKSFFWILYWLPIGLALTFPLVRISLISGNYDRLLIILQGIVFSAYAAKFIPITFLLLNDLFRLIGFIIQLLKPPIGVAGKKLNDLSPRNSIFQNIGLILGGFLFFLLIIGMFRWAHDYRVREIHLKISTLPEALNGFRMVQISDLHLGTWQNIRKLQEIVDVVNKLAPDVIFFTGDLVNYTTDEAFRFEKVLADFKSEYGVFTILGNHDYGDYQKWSSEETKARNLAELFSFYRRIGWKLLKNNHAIIEKNNHKIAIIGVENWGLFARYPRYGDIEKAKSGSEKADLRILLSHDPSYWEKIIKDNHPDIELTFSGHTHGFQFGIENSWLKWSPVQYLYRYWAGLYQNELSDGSKQYIYVNRGLGNVAYPGRVGILPEITLMVLTSD